MPKNLDCLSRAPVFSKLTERERVDLTAAAIERKYGRDEYVCWQGEVWPYVAFIVSGRLEWAMLSPEGRRQVVFSLGACEVVWGHSAVDGLSMPASLEVREEAVLYLWERGAILPVIQKNARAMGDVPIVLVQYMRHVREVVYGFAFHPVAGRLARLLLTHYDPVDGRPAPRNLTLDQMADTVGTTRELVSRTLHRFADEGMIRVNRVEFAFLDRDRLENLAGGSER
ncbi:MAG: Crp/Fnr family transcriptional regulator [Anaerolineales bacterium]|jgi:CRP-like cAMP-binding protein|nr:Crp/Fnr family transcriptional regulator [Anaerolineales bacterium]MDX9936437.1 Crp/Fnr family transcriptional regulator [Anaerolineales bacterium]GER80259.1 regulatory subunit of cAMP-dependent protein kinases [Candidatus Denitrolinea symbiosum]